MRSLVVLACALAALTPATSQAQDASAFIVRLGGDTLSLEQFTRTSAQVRGEFVFRSPRSLYRTYFMDLNPDGTVRRFELVTRTLGVEPAPPVTRSTVEFKGDSAIMVSPRGDSTVTRTVAVRKGAVPLLNGVMGSMDQIARQYRASGKDTLQLDLVTPGSTTLLKGTVYRKGNDKLNLDVVTQLGKIPPFVLTLDEQGGLKQFSGKGSVFQADGERIKNVNLVAATQLFEYRPLGALSARDTVRMSVGDSTLWVDYGRPQRRGRDIFGGVVPWNEVWRTGANAATQLHTPVELMVGETTVPPGTYSVWTLPSKTGWKLILNRQFGQWGTQYDASRDLARVDMKVDILAAPVETMTIDLKPDATGTLLEISWDKTKVSVPLRRKV